MIASSGLLIVTLQHFREPMECDFSTADFEDWFGAFLSRRPSGRHRRVTKNARLKAVATKCQILLTRRAVRPTFFRKSGYHSARKRIREVPGRAWPSGFVALPSRVFRTPSDHRT